VIYVMTIQLAARMPTDIGPKQALGKNRSPLQRKCSCGSVPMTGEGAGSAREHPLIAQLFPAARKERADAPEGVGAAVESPGEPLDSSTRRFMDPRFGHSFGHIRVHTDARAARSAAMVNAQAFTIGHDIVFGQGQYRPSTSEGRLLLAHELTHAVQQEGGGREVVNRQADESATPSGTAAKRDSGATQRLLAIIEDVERLQDKGAMGVASETERQEDGEELTPFVERLRAVAAGSDEDLKLAVLAGFSSEWVRRAESQLPEDAARVGEESPVSLAAKSLEVSHPRDPAEVEADRVALAVVNGSDASVTQTTSADSVNRQAEALAGAGAFILATEAESLPVTSWNPPGWVLLGVATVVAAALIGTAVYMGSNVADTGIVEEAQRLIDAAKAAGAALTICAALEQLMAAAKRAGDSARIKKIVATQKYYGCRHSSYS
jgi:hypothetical protein